MSICKVLLDFDGTLTDAEKGVVEYIRKWDELFSERTCVPVGVVQTEITKIKEGIISGPGRGWIFNGYDVAPALADPYVFHETAAGDLIEMLRGNPDYNIPADQESVNNMLGELFVASYQAADTVFREGAATFLKALAGRYQTTIVTNSRTDAVKSKLERLKLWNVSITVVGDVKKYVVDPSLDGVPESVQPEGFLRTVLLRRAKYKAILDGYNPGETAVVGDIYEMDMALPEYMGFMVIQLATPTTPLREIVHHNRRERNGARNYFATDFNDVLNRLAA